MSRSVRRAPVKNLNQPAHPRGLLRVFVVRMKELCFLGYSKNAWEASGPEVTKLFSCSTLLSMKISLLISREIFMLSKISLLINMKMPN